MGAATIGTLVGVAVIVAALAFYLTTIVFALKHVSFQLGTVLVGVRAIAAQTEPLSGVVGDIVNDIQSIDRELASALGEEAPAPRGGARRALAGR